MPASLESALLAGHAIALLALPLLLVLLVRERARGALARGAESAAVYFASAQWLAHLPAAVMVALAASIGSPLAWELRAVFVPFAGRFATLLTFPFVMLPLACATFASTFVLHGITRDTRGTDLTLGESLRQAAWVLAMLGAPVAGVLALRTGFDFARPQAGIVALLASLVLAVHARGRWAKSAGLEPHAVSHGPLRDRLFALASRAGVAVQQLYVLPTRRTRMANAFAVQGGVVLLTDWLLEHLDRRELDAVIAHELAHIRLGHPRKLAIAASVGIVAGAVAAPFWNFGAGIATGVLLSVAGTRFVARRFEFAADALAVQVCGDPEALITGLVRLARLNHLPMDWSRAAETGLTHPSMRRRVEAIARAAGIPQDRVRELVAALEPPRDPESVPPTAAPAGKVFSTSFKRGATNGLSWRLLFAAVALSAAGVALIQWLALPRALAALAGAAAALAAIVALTDLLAARGLARLRPLLARRLATRAGERFVGLAPGAASRVYEGFFDWDLGFLSIEDGALVYRGEEASFRLPRSAVVRVWRTDGPAGWVRAPRVGIEWQDPANGTRGVLQLRPAHTARLDQLPSAAAELFGELARWHLERADDGAGRFETPPREADVTGTPLARVAHPSSLVPVAILSGLASLLVAWSIGLSLWPFSGPGALDAWAGVVIALVAHRVPMWRAREALAEAPQRERRAA